MNTHEKINSLLKGIYAANRSGQRSKAKELDSELSQIQRELKESNED